MIRSPRYLFTLLLAGTLLLVTCSRSGPDDPPEPDKPTLTLRTTLTAFAAGGDDAEFSFATNRAWHIDRELPQGDNGDWLSVAPLKGAAGEQIAVKVTVAPNEDYISRSCTLLLRTEPNETDATGTVLEERIEVVQLKKNVILLGDNRCEVTFQEQTLEVLVRSNVEYVVAVTQGADWLRETPGTRAEGLKEKTHKFNIAANPDAKERTGVIVFTDKDSELFDELTVVQAAWVDPDPERTALQALYDAAGGGGWTRSDNWGSDRPLGEWYGVETDAEGRVIALRLPQNNLAGTIPDKIALLTHLQHLDLSWNALEGDLTWKNPNNYLIDSNLDDLLELETIDLSHNRLTGEFMPTHWYKITGLQQINLSSNLLKCYAIPIQWAPMFENGRMVDLILNDNYMYGDIPTAIQNHPEWDRMALQMIRQRSKDGSLNEMRHEKDIHLPDFTFTDLRDGSQRTIREVYGANKLTMLLAWNPEQEDSKTFAETIARRFHTLFKEQGFGVVAILPEGEEFRQAAEEYLRTHDVPWPVVSEYADAAGRRLILPSYPYPSYLLVDQSGKVTQDMFDGQRCDNIAGEPPMDMLSFRHSDWLGGFFSQTFGKSKYQSTDFSKDKQYETLQTATRGKGIDIVLVGEAFTDIDIETGFYRQLMEYAMESFFALEPTKSYREYFNIYMVYAVSRDTHIGNFTSDVETALGIYLENGSVEPDSFVLSQYMRACPIRSSYDTSVGIVIHDNNAGITSYNRPGPSNAFCGYPLGGRKTMRQNLLHELVGHGVGWLGDEYEHFFSGEITESAKRRLQSDQRQGYFLNLALTSDTSQVPWAHLVGHPRYPYVGAFEGGNYYNRGVWRSEEKSTMVSIFTDYFNAASRELIVKRIMKLSGEEYSFEKFLAKDSDAGRPRAQSAAERAMPRRADYVHHPPVFVDEL